MRSYNTYTATALTVAVVECCHGLIDESLVALNRQDRKSLNSAKEPLCRREQLLGCAQETVKHPLKLLVM